VHEVRCFLLYLYIFMRKFYFLHSGPKNILRVKIDSSTLYGPKSYSQSKYILRVHILNEFVIKKYEFYWGVSFQCMRSLPQVVQIHTL